jgi:O-antigen/teichoic acid export membrane protein
MKKHFTSWLHIPNNLLYSGALVNSISSLTRSFGKMVWGFAIPSLLSITDFGIYSLYQVTIGIFSQISLLGTPQVIMRESRQKLPLLGLFLQSLLIMIISIAIFIIFPNSLSIKPFLTLIIIAITISNSYIILTAWTKSNLHFGAILLGEVVNTIFILSSLAILLILKEKKSYEIFFTTFLIIEIIGNLIVCIAIVITQYKSLFKIIHTTGSIHFLPQIFSVGLLVLLDIVLYRKVEVYFLARSPSGIEGVAVFNVALIIANASLVLPGSVIEAWYPEFAHLYTENMQQFGIMVIRCVKRFTIYYFIYVVVIMTCLTVGLPKIYPEYAPWLGSILILVLTRIVFGYTGLFSSILYATKRERLLYLPGLFSAIITLVTNSLLTIHYGLNGAVVAFIINQIFITFAASFSYVQIFKNTNSKV